MKNLLQNLLILLAAGLCALVAWQWHSEAQLNGSVRRLEDAARRDREALQTLRGDLLRAEAEGIRLTRLNETNSTAAADAGRLREELQKSTEEWQRLTKQLESYEAALAAANASIKRQNESITAQNEELKKLVAERNEVVLKFNEMAAKYNDLAARWNALQEQAAKNPPTPAPPRK